MTRSFENESGYSMVEVLAAIVILSLAILPMVSMFDAGLRAAVLGGNYDKARALANSNLESIKGMDYSEAVTAYEPGMTETCPNTREGFTCSVATVYVNSELIPDTDSRTRMRVDVKVEWDGSEKSYAISGLTTMGSL